MDGGVSESSLARPASLLRVVRTFVSRFGENLHQHNNMQNVQHAKCPIPMRSSPRFQLLRRENFTSAPVLPCMHNRLLQLQPDDETALWSFTHKCLVLSPKKTFEFFFPYIFSSSTYSTAPRCQKSLESYRPRVLVDRPVLTKTFRFLIPSQFTVRSWA